MQCANDILATHLKLTQSAGRRQGSCLPRKYNDVREDIRTFADNFWQSFLIADQGLPQVQTI